MLREAKKARQRREILDACEDLFRRRGYDATGIDEILEAVGISRQTFFNYFPGKRAVLRELGFEWLAREGRRAVEGARGARRGDLLARLKPLLRRQLRAIEDDRDFMRLVFTRSGLFFPTDEAGDDPERAGRARGALELVAAGVASAQERGELRPDVDPHQAAEIYVAVFYVTVRRWLESEAGGRGGRQRLETRVLRAVEALMHGLAP